MATKRKRKRANGEGSVWEDKKKGKFRGRVPVGKDSSDKTTYISFTAETREEAEAQRTEIIHNRNIGVIKSKNDITVKELAIEWLNQLYIDQSSLESYEHNLRNHIFKMFENIKVQNLSQEDIILAYKNHFSKKKSQIIPEGGLDDDIVNGDIEELEQLNEIEDIKDLITFEENLDINRKNSKEANRKKKQKEEYYSRTTMAYIATKLKLLLKYAMTKNIISQNPHDGIVLSKIRIDNIREAKEIEAYSQDEQDKLTEYCRKNNNPLDFLYVFLILTGMRIGESLGLQWSKIDFKNKLIIIDSQAKTVDNVLQIVQGTKTRSSKRIIGMSAITEELLHELKSRQISDLNDLDLVFPSLRYTIRYRSNIARQFEKACINAGIPCKNLHALRHTYATRMIEQNCDLLTLSKLLGHKSITTTANIYVSILNKQRAKGAMIIDNCVKF